MADQRLAAKRIPGTGFLVDGFRFQGTPGTTAFFLTHAHSDHTVGLGRTFGRPRRGDAASAGNSGNEQPPLPHPPLYASPATAALIIHDTPRVDAGIVRHLPPGVPTAVPDGPGRRPVTVTALDANHCPGAVVLVFDVPGAEGDDDDAEQHASSSVPARPPVPTRVVHTGDFRYTPALSQHPLLSAGPPIDALFLDTTYASPAHAFPPQADAVWSAVRVLAAEAGVALPPRWGGRQGGGSIPLAPLPPPLPRGAPLFVVGSYRIGKERFYLGAAAALGWRVWVDPGRAARLRWTGLVDEGGRLTGPAALGPAAPCASAGAAAAACTPVLTPDPLAAAIHVVPMGGALSPPALRARLAAGGGRWGRAVAIRPTGWAHGGRGRGGGSGGNPPPSHRPPPAAPAVDPPLPRPRPGGPGVSLYAIPYSEHSSFPELRAAVAALRPRDLIPTVGATSPATRAALIARFADALHPGGRVGGAAARGRVTHYFARATGAAAVAAKAGGSGGGGGSGGVAVAVVEAQVAVVAAAAATENVAPPPPPPPPPVKAEAEPEPKPCDSGGGCGDGDEDDGWGPELGEEEWWGGGSGSGGGSGTERPAAKAEEAAAVATPPPPPSPPPPAGPGAFDLAEVDAAEQARLWAAAVARGRFETGRGGGGRPGGASPAAVAKRARRQGTLAGFVGRGA
jgi:DNA cross-link repair 1A protein